MFVFGQLVLAAILCALPLGHFGMWWYFGTAAYLFAANILTFFAWKKASDAYLKAASGDVGENSFKIREYMGKAFNGHQPHILVLCMMVAYAPLGGPLLILFLMRNKFLLKRCISRNKEKINNTFEDKVTLMWLEDLRDNGLFRTKL